jgi:hypothetical protein
VLLAASFLRRVSTCLSPLQPHQLGGDVTVAAFIRVLDVECLRRYASVCKAAVTAVECAAVEGATDIVGCWRCHDDEVLGTPYKQANYSTTSTQALQINRALVNYTTIAYNKSTILYAIMSLGRDA